MKKGKLIFTLLALFLFISSLYAQKPKWVSTEVQNRVAVLENFTGIKNRNAPKSDKRANELRKQYPNQFIIINNHCGLLAAPGIGGILPDLRTEEGDDIFCNSGRHGNPPDILEGGSPLIYGSINRATYPWAINPDEWQDITEGIINQPSIVNIYVKPEINSSTRELTVEVEYYYTDDSPASENFLTVMLLQNEIICYQDGGKDHNPDDIAENGYRHNHVLRTVITPGGAWGDTITNTRKGSYEYKKYTVVLPEEINKVPLDITNLEVVAFISESKSKIYTGHNSEFIRTDISVEDITEYSNSIKFETLHPKFKITNNYDSLITKFNITLSYLLANTQSTLNYDKNYYNISKALKFDTIITKTKTYSGTINKGEFAIVEFPEITRSDFKASSIYLIQSAVSNIFCNNLELIDKNTIDNKTETIKIGLIDTSFSETEITFENSVTASISMIPAHTVLDNTYNSYFTIDKLSGGAKNSKNAVLFLLGNYYESASKPGYIIFGEIDCKDNPNKILSYYYAYSDGRLSGTPPRIVVDISKDWGITWQRISEIFCKETGEASGDIYLPSSNQYKLVQINLYDYVKENFIIRVGGVPGTNGSALWIDEISIENASNESIEENIKMSIYPNPTTNILHINSNNLLGEEYEIYDLSGKLLIKDINNSNIINVENLSTGTYSLKIKDSIFNFIKE